MNKDSIAIVALFLAKVVTDNGWAPQPKNKEEAVELLDKCAALFMLFLMRGPPVPADCDDDCDSCAHCPDSAKPNRGGDGNYN